MLQNPVQNVRIIQAIEEVGEQYELLLKLKSIYSKTLNGAIIDQDVYKQKLFDESNLNIKLEMFSGNNDEVDFYTFKSDFSKIYNKSTPKELLPDLLKNNFLKDPAYG